MRYPLLAVFFTIMWLFRWSRRVFLVTRIVVGTFAGHDITGWGEAGLKDRGVITEWEFQQGKTKVLT